MRLEGTGMGTVDKGIELPDGWLELLTQMLMRLEGKAYLPYLDSKGVPTIGIGFTRLGGAPVTMGMGRISDQEIQTQLEYELGATGRLLTRVLKRVPSRGQAAAMGSLSYNIGGAGFCSSQVLKYFNLGEFAQASDAFGNWDRAGGRILQGLINRRKVESWVFTFGKLPGGPLAVAPPKFCKATVLAHVALKEAQPQLTTAELNAQELARVTGGGEDGGGN